MAVNSLNMATILEGNIWNSKINRSRLNLLALELGQIPKLSERSFPHLIKWMNHLALMFAVKIK